MEKSIRKPEFIRQIAQKSGKTAQEVLIVINAMESVVREQLVNNGIISLPNLVRIEKIIKPAKPARQRFSFPLGKVVNYKAKPAKVTLKIKPLRPLKDAVEGVEQICKE